jgi:hypothetical protein
LLTGTVDRSPTSRLRALGERENELGDSLAAETKARNEAIAEARAEIQDVRAGAEGRSREVATGDLRRQLYGLIFILLGLGFQAASSVWQGFYS